MNHLQDINVLSKRILKQIWAEAFCIKCLPFSHKFWLVSQLKSTPTFVFDSILEIFKFACRSISLTSMYTYSFSDLACEWFVQCTREQIKNRQESPNSIGSWSRVHVSELKIEISLGWLVSYEFWFDVWIKRKIGFEGKIEWRSFLFYKKRAIAGMRLKIKKISLGWMVSLMSFSCTMILIYVELSQNMVLRKRSDDVHCDFARCFCKKGKHGNEKELK